MKKATNIVLFLLSVLFLLGSIFVGCSPKTNENVAVTAVQVDPSATTLSVEDSIQLNVTVLPENATNKSVTFVSDHPEVVDVDSTGMLTALSTGTATITVTSESENKTATCVVTVVEDSEFIVSAELTAPTKKEYLIGQELSLEGGYITVTYKNEETKQVALTSTGVEVSGFSSETAGMVTVKVVYKNFEFSFEVKVSDLTVSLVAPSKTEYWLGAQELDLTGGKVIVTENGVDTDVPLDDERVKITGFDTTKAGKVTVSVSYNDGEPMTFDVNVKERYFGADSLKDVAYMEEMMVGSDEGIELTENGVVIKNGHTGLQIPVIVDKTVYGIRVKLSTESDGVCFSLSFDPQLFGDQANYASNWRGQLQNNTTVLHSQGGTIGNATKGEFEGLLRLRSEGSEQSGMTNYFGYKSEEVANRLSMGESIKMTINPITDGVAADSVSILVEEIEFLTEDEYIQTGRPKGDVSMTSAPSKTQYYQGSIAPDLTGGVFTIKEEGKEDVVVDMLNNPDIKILEFDTSTVGKTTVVLEYWMEEFSYEINIIENKFSYENMLNSDYQQGLFNVQNGGGYKMQDGKLQVVNNHEWGGFSFVTYLEETDIAGMHVSLSGIPESFLYIDIAYGNLTNNEMVRLNTGNFGTSGTYEGWVLFSQMIDPLTWQTVSAEKCAALQYAIMQGERIQLAFTIGEGIGELHDTDIVTIESFDLITQAEYDAAMDTSGTVTFHAPDKTTYLQGTQEPDLRGGYFEIDRDGEVSRVEATDKRVTVVKFDCSKPGEDIEAILEFGDVEYKFNITVVAYDMTFANLLTPDYLATFYGDSGMPVVFSAEDGKLKFTATAEWCSLCIPGFTNKKDAVGIYVAFESVVNNYMFVDVSYGDFSGNNTIRFNTGVFTSEKYSRWIKFDEFAIHSGDQKLQDRVDGLKKAIQNGEMIRIALVINTDVVSKTVYLTDFSFFTQAEYDAAMSVGEVSFVAPTVTQYYRGATKMDLSGGKFVVEGQDVALTDSNVVISGFDTSSVGQKTITFKYKSSREYSFVIDVVENSFGAGSLKDAAYLSNVAGSGEYTVTDTGVSVEASKEANFTIAANKNVYAVKLRFSSTSDGLSFIIRFGNESRDGNMLNQYLSHWQGSKYESVPALHATDGNPGSAKAGTFEAVIVFVSETGADNQFGWPADTQKMQEKMAAGETFNLFLRTESVGATGSIVFEEISFLTQEEYQALNG